MSFDLYPIETMYCNMVVEYLVDVVSVVVVNIDVEGVVGFVVDTIPVAVVKFI